MENDMAVLRTETLESLQFESEIYFKLHEAEKEASLTGTRYSSRDVLQAMRNSIEGKPIV